MKIEKLNIYKLLSLVLINVFLISCKTSSKTNREEYNSVYYSKLDNNNSASLEILNQINFLESQLKRKENGDSYSTYIAENFVILSGIPSDITAIGYFGNSYEITEEILTKWKRWYKENAEYISYEIINGKKYIVLNPLKGDKKMVLL